MALSSDSSSVLFFSSSYARTFPMQDAHNVHPGTLWTSGPSSSTSPSPLLKYAVHPSRNVAEVSVPELLNSLASWPKNDFSQLRGLLSTVHLPQILSQISWVNSSAHVQQGLVALGDLAMRKREGVDPVQWYTVCLELQEALWTEQREVSRNPFSFSFTKSETLTRNSAVKGRTQPQALRSFSISTWTSQPRPSSAHHHATPVLDSISHPVVRLARGNHPSVS